MRSVLFEEGTYPPRPIEKKQTLPAIVDGMAHAQPFALYAEYPYSPKSYEAGVRKVTYRDFANAINGLAWQLDEVLGPAENFPTLAYIGPNDLRYAALTLACVKVGYKLLLTSPRNSIAAHLSLFRATNCQVLLYPTPQPPAVRDVLDSCEQLRALEIPSDKDLLLHRHRHYPYNKTFEKARDEPLVVLHTSGTTGLPKPIIWTHDFMAAVHQWFTLAPPEGFYNEPVMLAGVKMLVTLPPFHAAGVMGACLPILYQTKAVYPPAGVLPSAQVVADALMHTTADVVLLAPPFVEEMCRDPKILDDILASVDSVVWIGGAIPTSVGDKVARGTKLWTMIGMTEASVLPTIRPLDWPHDDWQFVRFNPEANIKLRHNSDDLYEAIIVRHADPERAQPCFKTFPDLTEWSTKDLYSPHPSKPDLWLLRGRADDIIVFLNGEKTNPISMEQSVTEHPEVRAALVIGRLRFEAALLIELLTSKELSTIQRAQTVERIWPVVDRANQDCPRHAKVSKSHILFTSPRSPMLRSSKGTVQRQPTLDLYAREIDALYRDADAASRASHGPRQGTDIGNRAAVLAFVRGTIHLVAGNRLEDSDDFFASGMDSLQALHAARALNQGLSLPADIEISTIYKNPSILQLTESLLQLSVQREDMALDSKLSDTLKEYTKIVDGLPSFQIRTPTASEDRVVILTGSTGGIGCYLLQILLENPSVSHIYCLNRSSRSATIQKLRSGDRGLPTSFPHHRVTFLTSNLSEPGLGLDNETYKRVSGAAADIIHSAWPVNFNLALDAFRPHLDGVVCLLTLACISPSVRSIFFVSSTSTVAGSRASPVPEHVLDDLRAPAPMGYAQGKYLAERILDHAARARPGLDIKVARVGQVAGPAVGEGAWNRWEWLPSLVMSSFYLEAIPTSLGNSQAVDWLPIDVLAPVLIELALGSEKSETGAAFFHLSNPKLASWEHLLPSVIAALGGEKTIAKVSFADWLQLVRSAVADGSDPAQLSKVHPAVKLVTFYESLLLNQSPPLEMGKALQASEKLRDVGEIQGEWMQKWVRRWIA